MSRTSRIIAGLTLSLAFTGASGGVFADAGHHSKSGSKHGESGMMDSMREMHRGHAHGHDFKAMEEVSPERAARMIELMRDIGLALPPMDSSRGRKLFAEKGCVVCHSVNGVGSDIGPSLNAADMPSPMNAFEFAARMWRGAAAMTAMQEAELGGVIGLTGQELADLVAFAHDAKEQKKLTKRQIPKRFRKIMER